VTTSFSSTVSHLHRINTRFGSDGWASQLDSRNSATRTLRPETAASLACLVRWRPRTAHCSCAVRVNAIARSQIRASLHSSPFTRALCLERCRLPATGQRRQHHTAHSLPLGGGRTACGGFQHVRGMWRHLLTRFSMASMGLPTRTPRGARFGETPVAGGRAASPLPTVVTNIACV